MRPVIVVLCCILAALTGAQTREFVGGHLDKPPTIDGKIEPDEYRDALHFDGLVDSGTGAPSPEGGTFYLAYDAQYVYFAAKLVDLQPSSIQATEYRTNVSLRGNDTIRLNLDPFGTLSDFNGFEMNARGGTYMDIAGGRAAKREWLGDFVSKGRITTEGWEVEARIPWSVMRLPSRGAHDLRFNVYRQHRRLQRNYSWSQTSNGLVQNYGRWKAVDLPAAQPPRLRALPYVYGGIDGKRGVLANAGLDLRYPLTPDLDFVGTISPDFRNVERGVLSLDFSYFERLADETRPFFLEGGRYFRENTDAPIFVSQRIGDFDTGGKVFGKLDAKTDVGVLATADFGHEDAVVARVRRQESPRTDWAAMFAGGGKDGRRNDAASGVYNRGVGSWTFTGRLAAVQDETEGTGHRALAAAQYSQNRTYMFGEYVEVTRNFNPRLGFAPLRDYRGVDVYARQSWAAPKRGLVDYGIDGGVTKFQTYDLRGPYLETASFSPDVTLKDGTRIDTELRYERYLGGSSDQTYGASIERPLGDPYRHWGVGYRSGTRNYRPYRDFSAGAAYRPLPTLQLNASYQKTTYGGTTIDQKILSANYDLDQYHSVGGRVVSGPGISNFYVSFRQSGNRGAEYYLILGDPNAAHFRASLILKAVFPLSFKL